MLYLPLGIRIIFRPKDNKFSQVMGAKNGPIPGKVIKVVHDDGNEKVEDKEGTDDEESDKVYIGKIRTTSTFLASIVRLKKF